MLSSDQMSMSKIDMSDAVKNLKVNKGQFDTILQQLIATPPKPVTPKRKRRRKVQPKAQ